MTPSYYRDLFLKLRELTIRTVESMPEEQIAYQPPHSRSFAEIALHIVGAQYDILNWATGREEKPSQELTPRNYPTRAALAALLRAEQQHAVEVLNGLDEAALARVVPAPFGGDGPAEMLLSILLVHEADHKGNLVMAAKVQGADPPDVRRLTAQGSR